MLITIRDTPQLQVKKTIQLHKLNQTLHIDIDCI
jgi:hypothetical protein